MSVVVFTSELWGHFSELRLVKMWKSEKCMLFTNVLKWRDACSYCHTQSQHHSYLFHKVYSITMLCCWTSLLPLLLLKHLYQSHPIVCALPFPVMVSATLPNHSKNRLFLHCTNIVSLLQSTHSTGSPCTGSLAWALIKAMDRLRVYLGVMSNSSGVIWPSDDLWWYSNYCRLRGNHVCYYTARMMNNFT